MQPTKRNAYALTAVCVFVAGLASCSSADPRQSSNRSADPRDHLSTTEQLRPETRDRASNDLGGRETPKSAARAFLIALGAGRARVACSLIDRRTVNAIVKGVAGTKAAGQDCPGLIALIVSNSKARRLDGWRHPRVKAVRVHGAHGSVVYKAQGEPVSRIPVKRQGGLWTVTAMGGTPLRR